ncbi:MAG: 30S ribosomal protein S11 [Alphaproteobacteria bacterium RIFCSPLOWO2_01_FULL_40_26]|nr:MAG: 30S ribosomal protein S11 [Alphaproteobacteria bacterium RIFCSPHIGHO2_02_FULL_40_34]OFW86344.1 MAG: 30S ribosomal protein S11 [Alphaproteobacteria bacterium RIFCSPHIGHO2_01_FULL_40_8]OFW95105.1 MAG: 30S ribosomal protein S11 [Alphaproteobacteria bacterium RIFCSPLOWO2_01_FULL_40_26]OFX09072.1 MAG: 30S ribosomal protein S11 [Alphaproteobacteria bacterium RIFCSPLOWO2_02_FULL_40_19]OFX10707.1 MAG: 30S ribosomal protein S11 [Alphaproteobacteria bacterium RIFCSPLOWO2_12_FULL_40_11]
MTETKIDAALKEKKISKSASKKKKNVVNGIIHIYASFNNTIITISDSIGNVVCWSSAGKQGFKGSRKSTPYAAQIATQYVLNIAKDCGLQNAVVEVRGPGVGREASLRAIQASGLNVTLIKDITYHPHNGCRPAKRRRV